MADACEHRMGLSELLVFGFSYIVVQRSATVGLPGVEHGVVDISALCSAGGIHRFQRCAEAESKCDSDENFCFGLSIGAHTRIECDSVGSASFARSVRDVDQV